MLFFFVKNIRTNLGPFHHPFKVQNRAHLDGAVAMEVEKRGLTQRSSGEAEEITKAEYNDLLDASSDGVS